MLAKATVAVRQVEVRMLTGMSAAEQAEAFRPLRGMVRAA